MKRFEQVRLIADASRYGQLAWIEDRTEDATTGPLWECSVQWAGEGGNTRGHYFSEIRPETFLEFLFKRPGYIGKMAWPWAVWFFAVMCMVAIKVPVIAIPFLLLYFSAQWLNFKGILE